MDYTAYATAVHAACHDAAECARIRAELAKLQELYDDRNGDLTFEHNGRMLAEAAAKQLRAKLTAVAFDMDCLAGDYAMSKRSIAQLQSENAALRAALRADLRADRAAAAGLDAVALPDNLSEDELTETPYQYGTGSLTTYPDAHERFFTR